MTHAERRQRRPTKDQRDCLVRILAPASRERWKSGAPPHVGFNCRFRRQPVRTGFDLAPQNRPADNLNRGGRGLGRAGGPSSVYMWSRPKSRGGPSWAAGHLAHHQLPAASESLVSCARLWCFQAVCRKDWSSLPLCDTRVCFPHHAPGTNKRSATCSHKVAAVARASPACDRLGQAPSVDTTYPIQLRTVGSPYAPTFDLSAGVPLLMDVAEGDTVLVSVQRPKLRGFGARSWLNSGRAVVMHAPVLCCWYRAVLPCPCVVR